MTDQQIHKLEKAIELIEDALYINISVNSQNMIVGLSVAGDYCNEVAEEIKEEIIQP